jgi:hypothetical protein
MFSRKSCYFFVRPKKSFLEVCVFLGRPLKAPQVRRSDPSSKSKFANIIQLRHRDEVEAPITDWLREAYEHSDSPATRRGASLDPPKKSTRRSASSDAPKKAKRSRKTKPPSRAKRAKRN